MLLPTKGNIHRFRKNNMKKEDSNKFTGFPKIGEPGTFWMYPKVMDQYWYTLSGSEQKVLDYLLRRTFGWQKPKDQVSIGQFAKGLNGRDTGTGLSERAVIRALDMLEQRGFIKIQRFIKDTGEKEINEYRLVMSKKQKGDDKNTPRGNDKNSLPRDVGNTGTINSSSINRNSINRAIREISVYYKEKILSGARCSDYAKRNIATRLEKDGFTPDELKKAIQNFSEDGFSMKKNGHRGIGWFFQYEDRVEGFKNMTPAEYYGE